MSAAAKKRRGPAAAPPSTGPFVRKTYLLTERQDAYLVGVGQRIGTNQQDALRRILDRVIEDEQLRVALPPTERLSR